ncbi:unnamed protein product [Penicillium salamii]|uniref:Uncharacterized protein n=1 Tax=Penicillium salamii TaxID=1612424 RepID=A0A9W4IMB3_9EURO|nr:unnamed protein product [Penicillium salamii]CAG7959387.1 unnamed protein product [Penicillium salamii]CAG7989418.1 unnamed protein product [Penicillium salamii]CAG8098455.1 unnamed protein product [Penicillium salamii]CAG8267840.1 unnamed protein product [Penicillium salamii]
MDHELPKVSERSNTPDTEEYNGLIWQTGNESAENFRRVVGQFTHGNRGHISQVLQPAVDQSTTSVATEVATSVATSVASPGSYTLPPIVIKTENPDFPPLIAKRAAESSSLPRKKRRHSYSISQKPDNSQGMHRKSPLNLTTVSVEMVNDTIQYLQMLSDRILVSDTISSREWATMHLATRLLQSRYEEIIARKEAEPGTVSDLDTAPTQPGEKCRQCAAVYEERLYD